jgi:hypothetical protein
MVAEPGVQLAHGEGDLTSRAADRHGDAQQLVLGVEQAGRVGRRGVADQRLEQHASVGNLPAALLHSHGGLWQRRELRGRVGRRAHSAMSITILPAAVAGEDPDASLYPAPR